MTTGEKLVSLSGIITATALVHLNSTTQLGFGFIPYTALSIDITNTIVDANIISNGLVLEIVSINEVISISVDTADIEAINKILEVDNEC